jgi:uncharacterized membrane protein HdeD (DUF308 family)
VALTLHDADQRAAYWPVPIARAIPAAGLGLVITFSADHSARLGLIVFGIFGIVSGIVIAVASALRLADSGVRSFFIAQGAVTVVAGVLSIVATGGGVQYLFLIVTVFAAITGFLELYSGLRTRGRFVGSGDWMAMGAFTAAAAVVFVLIPPGFSQTFTGPDGVVRVLDSAVVAVGLLGAYGAIAAVYLLIAGLSAKWGTQSASAAGTIQPSEAERETSE